MTNPRKTIHGGQWYLGKSEYRHQTPMGIVTTKLLLTALIICDMGYRLHVASKYDVRYGKTEAFNHKNEEFHCLLRACGVEYTGESNDDTFEVSRADWTNGLIGKLTMLEKLPEEDRLKILACIRELGSTPDEVLDLAKRLIAEADPEHSYIVLCYW